MKKKSVAILGIVLTVLLLALSPALAIGGSNKSDMEQAREIAQREIAGAIDDFPEWEGAETMDGQPYCNLEGDVICYWFAVSKEGKMLGNVVVGSWLYDHTMFKLGTGHTPSVPTADEVSSYMEKDLALEVAGKDIGEPLYLVYATYSFYFAIYEIEGRKIGIDLTRRKAVPASDLQMGIASPEQYRQHMEERRAKPDWEESLPLPPSPPGLDIGMAPPGQLGQDKEEGGTEVLGEGEEHLWVPLHSMASDDIYILHRNNNNCGPTSGSMVVLYHKYNHGYANFDDWEDVEPPKIGALCHSDLHDPDDPDDDTGLYYTMHCNWPWPKPGVLPTEAGPGWIEYAEDCGYYNFVTRNENSDPDSYTYEEIKSYIDIESPFMILFQLGSPYKPLHWCTLDGYEYNGDDEIWIADPHYKREHLSWPVHYYTSWLTYIRPLVTSYDIPLAEGWNLISLPLIPASTAITDIINAENLASGNIDNVDLVYYFDTVSESWLWWNGAPASTLTTMEDGKGYWISIADSPDILTVHGTDTASPGQSPPEYEVFEGWNMIGFTSPVDIAHERYLDTISDDYQIVYGWDTETEAYFSVYPLGAHGGRMEPGYGYWILMDSAGTIVAPWG